MERKIWRGVVKRNDLNAKKKEREVFKKEIDKCELCGSKRNLEVHHIIPMVCANKNIDLDVSDNWICICSACHSKLTPRSLLTKYGIKCGEHEIKRQIFLSMFEKIGEAIEENEYFCGVDLMDVLLEFEKEELEVKI